MRVLPLVLSVFLCLLLACKSDRKSSNETTSISDSIKVESTDQKVVSLVTRGMDFNIQDTLKSGWTTFKYENLSNETHFFLLDKYPEGKTITDAKNEVLPAFDEGMALINEGKGDEAMLAFGKLPEWFSQVRFVGGSGLIAPKHSTTVTMNLEPGYYIMECYVKMPNGQFHGSMGMVKNIIVTDENNGYVEPKNDYSVDISSTEGIVMKQGLEKGNHTIAVHFKDQGVYEHFLGHDINLAKLDSNANVEELEAWMNWASPEGLKTPVPAGITFLGGVNNMEAGNTGYFEVNLKPGNYAFIAEVPNARAKNMLKTFEVID